MSKHTNYTAKHRQDPTPKSAAAKPKKARRTSLVMSTLAVAVTGTVVTGGLLSTPAEDDPAAVDLRAGSYDAVMEEGGEAQAAASGEREPAVSRSDRRTATDRIKLVSLTHDPDSAMSRTEDLSDADPRTIGRAMLSEFGFSSGQFGCLDSLWTKESNWTVDADNPTSSAYGIPQALPGSKMSSAGADWATNPVTQIRWGLGYIKDRYGSPCSAWAHSQSHNWY